MKKNLISPHFPYLPINIQVHRHSKNIQALIDTGFDGFVVISRQALVNGDPPDGYIPCTLADGSKIAAPFYRGTIRIGNFASFICVILAMGDESLIGRKVIDRFKVIFDHGKKVIIEE